MTKDEALKLSMEAMEITGGFDVEINAIKEALMSGTDGSQPEQEPVAFICEFYADEGHPFVSFEPVTHGTNTPLYTTPPQRTWVGLTDAEANELWESTDSDWELMKRTEAKLKEKNT